MCLLHAQKPQQTNSDERMMYTTFFFITLTAILVVVCVIQMYRLIRAYRYRGFTPQMLMHSCISYAACFALVRCVDPQGYRARLPFLVVQEMIDATTCAIFTSCYAILYTWTRVLHIMAGGKVRVEWRAYIFYTCIMWITVFVAGYGQTRLDAQWIFRVVKLLNFALYLFIMNITLLVYGLRLYRQLFKKQLSFPPSHFLVPGHSTAALFPPSSSSSSSSLSSSSATSQQLQQPLLTSSTSSSSSVSSSVPLPDSPQQQQQQQQQGIHIIRLLILVTTVVICTLTYQAYEVNAEVTHKYNNSTNYPPVPDTVFHYAILDLLHFFAMFSFLIYFRRLGSAGMIPSSSENTQGSNSEDHSNARARLLSPASANANAAASMSPSSLNSFSSPSMGSFVNATPPPSGYIYDVTHDPFINSNQPQRSGQNSFNSYAGDAAALASADVNSTLPSLSSFSGTINNSSVVSSSAVVQNRNVSVNNALPIGTGSNVVQIDDQDDVHVANFASVYNESRQEPSISLFNSEPGPELLAPPPESLQKVDSDVAPAVVSSSASLNFYGSSLASSSFVFLSTSSANSSSSSSAATVHLPKIFSAPIESRVPVSQKNRLSMDRRAVNPNNNDNAYSNDIELFQSLPTNHT
eukprot:TRINITY_DN4436_c0_g1_i1.p1 TRINITY_DN4436_c0_g1~~TRINITY_DN4436_c0_g1_i1.p1  ORF type:complete len:635 (+),score=135.72 TRINITY_DN4436_c0_g1_i1:110-2014(+)